MKKIILVVLIISIIACSLSLFACNEPAEENETDYFNLESEEYKYLFEKDKTNLRFQFIKSKADANFNGNEELETKYNDAFFEKNILIVIPFQYYYEENNIRVGGSKVVDDKILINVYLDSPKVTDDNMVLNQIFLVKYLYVEIEKNGSVENYSVADIGMLVVNDSGIKYLSCYYDCRRK